MRRHALVVPCLLVFAACSASAAGSDHTSGVAADGGGPTLPRSFADVSEVACRNDRDVVTAAVEAYVLLTPPTPVDEATLVEERFLREASAWYDVEPDGVVVAAPGSPCT